ncbi:diguanylate cyclase domain-containing protein [Actinoplanes sp. HUAS TT8]|uniref:GGDEF domain-containing protein n=1 Tax=Actinoplanes sp. HUAS TT8 TaxID=3447453 RepID=UPI003F51B775
MPFQLRDKHGATRAVAYLMLAGAPYNVITGVLMQLGAPPAELVALVVTSVSLFVIGVVCWRRPDALPEQFWLVVPLLAIAVVTGLNFATQDATTAAQLFYLWPLLYAATFLSRTMGYLTAASISAGHAAVVFNYAPMSQAPTDWIAMTVAMAMTAWVVINLNERNDRLRAVLEVQASSDSLTGAANRRAFDEALQHAVHQAVDDGDPAALVLIDVDHFKAINDTWGHATGDLALRAVADALRAAGKDTQHLVARLGGDEFAVLLRCGPEQAFAYAESARARLGATGGLPGGPPALSIGIGVAPHHAHAAEELQRVADAALYQAKENGRGRTSVVSSAS